MGAITFLFGDQSSSRRMEKIGEDIPSSPEVIGAHTLILGQNLIKLLQLFFWERGGPRRRWGVR